MSKFAFLAKIYAYMPTLPTLLCNHKWKLLREKCIHRVGSSIPIVRRILGEKFTIFRSSSVGSVGTSPNFAHENEHLREGVVNSPVDDYFPDSHDLGDEFDHEDYDEWWYGDERDYEDELNEWDWDYDEFDSEPLDLVEEVVSWTRRAVDEFIAEEGVEGEDGPDDSGIRFDGPS